MCCRSGSAQMLEFEATAGLWVREIKPTTVYDNDGVTVWSTSKGDRRYRLIEFDLSGVAGGIVVSAKLQLYSAVHGWSDYRTPIRQHAAVIDCSSGTAPSVLDWATYISEKDADKVALETLGRYDLPAADGDPLQQNAYVDSAGSSADVALIQAAVDGDGKFCLVLIADESGAYGQFWGDGDGNWSGPAPNLHIELLSSQAYAPDPYDDAAGISRDVVLRWRPGMDAALHNIYFGTDFEQVKNAADPHAPPGQGAQLLGNETFVPSELSLNYDTTYYWRSDEGTF